MTLVGKLSSDPAIREYCRDFWKVKGTKEQTRKWVGFIFEATYSGDGYRKQFSVRIAQIISGDHIQKLKVNRYLFEGTMKKVRELGKIPKGFCIKQTKNVILFLNNKLRKENFTMNFNSLGETRFFGIENAGNYRKVL